MKIRHKQTGVVLEGAFDERAYWVGSTRHEYFGLVPESSTYDKKEWEEVKPVWKDVTAECEAGVDTLFHRVECLAEMATGYRLRKVRLLTGIPPFSGEKWVFIVEQRQP